MRWPDRRRRRHKEKAVSKLAPNMHRVVDRKGPPFPPTYQNSSGRSRAALAINPRNSVCLPPMSTGSRVSSWASSRFLTSVASEREPVHPARPWFEPWSEFAQCRVHLQLCCGSEDLAGPLQLIFDVLHSADEVAVGCDDSMSASHRPLVSDSPRPTVHFQILIVWGHLVRCAGASASPFEEWRAVGSLVVVRTSKIRRARYSSTAVQLYCYMYSCYSMEQG